MACSKSQKEHLYIYYILNIVSVLLSIISPNPISLITRRVLIEEQILATKYFSVLCHSYIKRYVACPQYNNWRVM
jgi:hypothetical protein